jgi:dynein-related subfamily AAA family protein
VKVPSEWHELVKLVAPFLGVGTGPHRVLCGGPPGTGKSSWSAYVWESRVAERVALTEETCPEDLLGHYVLKGHDTLFVEGPATRAWKQGAPLVLDEIDRTSSSVVSLLHALLDDTSIARITLPTGETITPQAGFVCIGTTNAPFEALHEALLDRFEIVLHCHTPSPGAIAKMPTELRSAVSSYYRGQKAQPWSAPLSVRRGLALTAIAELTGNWEFACALVLGSAAKEVASVLASQRAK